MPPQPGGIGRMWDEHGRREAAARHEREERERKNAPIPGKRLTLSILTAEERKTYQDNVRKADLIRQAVGSRHPGQPWPGFWELVHTGVHFLWAMQHKRFVRQLMKKYRCTETDLNDEI